MSKFDQLMQLVNLLGDSSSPPEPTHKHERAVVVFTDKSGVFFGYTNATCLGSVHLRDARDCYYWADSGDEMNRGFLGLASHGPSEGSKISATADIELTGVTCIAECTEKAIAEWGKAKWKI